MQCAYLSLKKVERYHIKKKQVNSYNNQILLHTHLSTDWTTIYYIGCYKIKCFWSDLRCFCVLFFPSFLGTCIQLHTQVALTLHIFFLGILVDMEINIPMGGEISLGFLQMILYMSITCHIQCIHPGKLISTTTYLTEPCTYVEKCI